MPTQADPPKHYYRIDGNTFIVNQDAKGFFCLKCKRLKNDGDCAEDSCPLAKRS